MKFSLYYLIIYWRLILVCFVISTSYSHQHTLTHTHSPTHTHTYTYTHQHTGTGHLEDPFHSEGGGTGVLKPRLGVVAPTHIEEFLLLR